MLLHRSPLFLDPISLPISLIYRFLLLYYTVIGNSKKAFICNTRTPHIDKYRTYTSHNNLAGIQNIVTQQYLTVMFIHQFLAIVSIVEQINFTTGNCTFSLRNKHVTQFKPHQPLKLDIDWHLHFLALRSETQLACNAVLSIGSFRKFSVRSWCTIPQIHIWLNFINKLLYRRIWASLLCLVLSAIMESMVKSSWSLYPFAFKADLSPDLTSLSCGFPGHRQYWITKWQAIYTGKVWFRRSIMLFYYFRFHRMLLRG